jgi:hypothetical protein
MPPASSAQNEHAPQKHDARFAACRYGGFELYGRMLLRTFILWLLALATAYPNDIVAWNYPLSGYQDGGLKRKLDAPPESSVFFKQDDVLHDITPPAADMEEQPDKKLDWLVWNETSGLIVGKGPLQALYLLAGKLRTDELPLIPKMTLDVFEIAAGGQVAADAIPSCSLSAVSRSGSPFVLKQTSGPWSIELEGEVSCGESKLQDDIRMDSEFSLVLSKADEGWKIETNVASQAGGTERVARSVRQGQGIEVRASFELLLPDGRVRVDDVFEEKDGKAQRLDRALVDEAKTSSGWFKSIRMSSESLEIISPEKKDDKEADPFAEKSGTDDSSKFKPPFPLVGFPEETNGWVGRPLWDISELLKLHDVTLETGDKAGYDPLRDQLCLFSEKKSQVDLVDSLLMGCISYSLNIAVSVNTPTEELSVTAKNLQQASLSHTKGKVTRSIQTETRYGAETTEAVEVALEMSYDDPQSMLKVTNIVWDGETIPLGKMNVAGENPLSWSLKAEVLPLVIHP